MIFAIGQQRRNKPNATRAFTLIELILVLTLLSVAVSVAAPTLSDFFRGRKQDSEARRFLGMIRYGQSRAVSEGIPTRLWIDEKAGAYGLEWEPGYVDDDDPKAIDFTVDDVLSIKIEDKGTNVVMSKSKANDLPAIRCLIDGTFGATSPVSISINEGKSTPILIVQNDSGLSYEIQNQNKNIERAFR